MKKWSLIFILILTACATRQPLNGTAIDDMTVALHEGIGANETLPPDQKRRSPGEISNALMPDFRQQIPRQVDYSHRRFDISVKDVPARTFYIGLVTDTPISIVVSPEIKGKVTLNLKQVTVEQVLQTLEDTYNYTYNRIPGGYEVLPNTLKTQIYAVNYLELQRNGNSDMRLHSGEVTEVVGSGGGAGGGGGGVGGGVGGAASAASSSVGGATGATSVQGSIGRVETKSTVDFWKQLQSTLENMIGKENDRGVTVNPLAGVVVVRAYPKELKQVEAYLDLVQNSMDRQVLIEAKILEVTLNDKYQMGIDWNAFNRLRLNSIRDFTGTGISLSDFPNAYTATIRWTSNFVSTIQLLGTQGNVQVLSSPRVATMNNQQSMIKVGVDEFFVSGITPGAAVLGAVTQPVEQITPFFSGITLDVTPQIDAHGDITLHVHPSISLVTEQIKDLFLGATKQGVSGPEPTTSSAPLAHSTIRESDTIVHAKNGQVVIIGGLMQNQTIEDIAELPFFGNVPFLGTLFRATKQTSQKSELVILIKATVVNKSTMNRSLIGTTQRMAGLKRGFHIGGRPDIFGTEGEEPITLGPKAGDYNPARKIRCRQGMACSRRPQVSPNLAEK